MSKMEDKPKPEVCESCDFDTADLEHFPGGPGLKEKWICKLCAGTVAGNLLNDSRAYGHESAAILRTICYVGNAIIQSIEKKGETQ